MNSDHNRDLSPSCVSERRQSWPSQIRTTLRLPPLASTILKCLSTNETTLEVADPNSNLRRDASMGKTVRAQWESEQTVTA